MGAITLLRFARAAIGLLAISLASAPLAQHYRDVVRPWPALKGPIRILQSSDCEQLFETTKVKVKADGSSTLEYETAFELSSERAFPLAEVLLSYNRSYQALDVKYARTVRSDGRTVNLDRSQIFTGSPFEGGNMYSDVALTRFSMPGIERGCRIEYGYRVTSKPFLLPGNFWQTWQAKPYAIFGSEQGTVTLGFPVKQTTFTLEAPAGMNLQVRKNGDRIKDRTERSTDGKTVTFVWEATFVPALEFEPLMPPATRVLNSVEVSSIPSWPELASMFSSFFEPTVKLDSELIKVVENVTRNEATKRAKAEALCTWVSNKVRYVGVQFGILAFKPHRPNDVFKKLYGDCKDKTYLLIAMLASIGVKAKPLLVSASDPESISVRLPNPYCFDHVVCEIELDEGSLIVDVTDPCFPFGEIPASVRGTETLAIVADGTFKRVKSFEPEENGCLVEGTLVLNSAGDGIMTYHRTQRGQEAIAMRHQCREMDEKQQREFAQAQVKQFSTGAVLKDYKLEDGAGVPRPFHTRMTASLAAFGSRTSDLLLIPIGKLFEVEAPFRSESRANSFYWPTPSSHDRVIEIQIPDGFAIAEIPSSIESKLPLRRDVYSVASADGGKKVIVSQLRTLFAGEIPATDSPQVLAHFQALSKAGAWVLVLKRVEK